MGEVMNILHRSVSAFRSAQGHRHRISGNQPRTFLVPWVLALMLALFGGAATTKAAGITYNWTNTTGAAFNDPYAWTPTNGPGTNLDTANFSVTGVFEVPLTNNFSGIGSLQFGAAGGSGNNLTVSLNFGTNIFAGLSGNTTSASGFVFGQGGNTIVYISVGTMYCTNANATPSNARLIVGRNGPATVFLTNGTVVSGNLVIGNSTNANGSQLVISGPNSYWTNQATVTLGNGANTSGDSLVISNSGSMTMLKALDVGTLTAASSSNSVLVDTGGELFTRTQTANIGTGGNSSNNTVTVQGGGLWDNGAQAINIGSITGGSGNSLIVGNNGTVSNVTAATISIGNCLVLSGGVLHASIGVTNNSGTISGFGTIAGNVVFTGTGTLSPGFGTSVGTLTLPNNLTLASGSTTILKLDNSQVGSNDQLNIAGTLTEAGALIVITNGITPLNIGDQYQILVGSQAGAFSTNSLPPLNPSELWDTNQLASAGILAVTFQPVVPGIVGPSSQVATQGSTVVISTTVTGVPIPGVYWQLNGTNTTDGPTGNGSTITGSTSLTLTLANVQTADSGTYCLIATNSAGVATNCTALTVANTNVAPSITGISDQTVIQGNNATFAAAVAGLPPPVVQWYENSAIIPGATAVPLVLTNVQFSQNGYSYSLTASNVAGTATAGATLYVIVPPAIQAQPQSIVVTNSQTACFSVASTNGVPAPGYQWSFNNNAITDATNATYCIASATPTNTGNYNVTIANTAGSITSTNATLTVDSAMTVTLFPSNGAVNVCYDTPLFMTFSQTPVLSGMGQVNIYNVTNPATPVDTIDTSLGQLQLRSIGGDGTFATYPIIINGNTAQIYPHLGLLSSNQQYYVTIDAGLFTDTNSALFAGITTSNGWVFATKPTGPATPTNVVVATDESGDFATVQGAVDSVSHGNTTYTLINVRNGLYTEIVDVTAKNNITFRGQDRNLTMVGYPNNNSINGTTSKRMAFKVNANDIAVENMTVTNMTPEGGSAAEAFEVYTGAQRCILNNAVVSSFQNTILINTVSSQAYFYNSSIEGDAGFLWGAGNLFVTNCEIRTVNPNTSIAQPRTPDGSNGFSFVNCQLTRTGTSVTNTTLAIAQGYCGGSTAYIDCQIDSNVIGWTASDLTNCPGIPWWEYGNVDLLTGVPVSYNGIQLTNGDSRLTLASTASLWLNGWQPQLAPNILTNPVSMTVSAGVAAAFSVTATGIPDPSYQWIFNSSTVLTGATNATLVITNAQDANDGTYSVIVSNGAGSVTSAGGMLTVIDGPPVADFTGTPTIGQAPLTVAFTDSSTGTLSNRFWSFGDSGTTNTTATTVVYTYQTAGTDTVSLTVSGPLGSSNWTEIAYIVVTNPPAPVADFSGSPTLGGAPLTVTFTDTSTGNITNRFWSFGDGSTLYTTTNIVSYTYETPGADSVSLTVFGLGGFNETNLPNYIIVTNVVSTPSTDPPLPNIPGLSTNVASFGANGNGVFNNASAIQSAINAVSAAGGGTVVVSAVGILTNYLSGPITLASQVCLDIDTNTVLRMLPMNSWPLATTPFIRGSTVHDIEISGAGTIDGQGTNWWFPLASTRPYLINLSTCSNVLIQGVTLQNPPEFHMMLKGNNVNLTVQGITVNTPADAPNTDGMDLASTNVLIRNCSISCGDDNIEIGGSGPATAITISNCTFGTGHGLSIGSTTSGGVQDLLVSNCTFNGTEYGIHMKSDRDRGGLVQNLTYLDLTMTNVTFPIAVYSYYNEIGTPKTAINVSPDMASTDVMQAVTATTPIWQNVIISHVTATAVQGNIAGLLWGLPEMLVSNFTLNDVNIMAPTKTFEIYNAQGIDLVDSQLGGPISTNMLTLYNAQITVTNSVPGTNLVTVGGLAVPPTNNSLAFFNAPAAISGTSVLGTGPITLDNSTLTFQQNSVSSSNTPLSILAASTLAFAGGDNDLIGSLDGTGALTLSLPASTVLYLKGDCSDFTGSCALSNGGTLRFDQGDSVWGAANAAFDAGPSGTIGNSSSASITIFLGGLTGGSESALQGSTQTGPAVDTYVIGGLDSNTTFAGTIADGTSGGTPHIVAVTTIGTGALALSGANTYGGGTTVSNGILLVNNATGSGTGSGAVTVVSGATLGGTGIVGGPVTVYGTLSPGNGSGTLTISNNLVLVAGAVLQYELGTNSSQSVVSGNLTLNGTLNVTDGGGFSNGTYTLFRYSGTLVTNGSANLLTIGTTPDPSLGYTVDISSPGYVRLVIGPPTMPVAGFTANPTNGPLPLLVTFTDSSTGSITNRFWNFGDGATMNVLVGRLTHTYNTVGVFDVSLTVTGPAGTNTLTQSGCITTTPALPKITSGVTTPNAVLQVGNVILVVAGETNVFSVGATSQEGGTLSYQWSFGDGTTSDFLTTNSVEHAYTNECGPYEASVTISNGLAATTSNFDVMVACQLGLKEVQPKLDFARTNADGCALVGSFPAPSNTVFAGQVATLDIGGASLTFTFPLKGNAVNGRNSFDKPTYDKSSKVWKLKATFKDGSWQAPWADYGMINSNIPKPGVLVTNLPVILLLDTDGFMATTNLHYTAKEHKSGEAR